MGLHRKNLLSHIEHSPISFKIIYPAMLLLTFHWMIVAYMNSSYLENYVSKESIGLLYIVGASLTIFIFLFISRILRIVGNVRLTIILSLIELAALIGLGFSETARVAIPLFIVHFTVTPLIVFNLDVFSETLNGIDESNTGSRRGLILTTMSLASAMGPLVISFVSNIGDGQIRLAYHVSAFVLIVFILFILIRFRTFSDPVYKEIDVLRTLRTFWIKKDIRNVFFAHFLLQIFFAWMVIYTPVYLVTQIGMPWEQVGVIISVGLLAYVLLEYPIGIIADRYIGEKEMMALGFVILAVSTAWFAYIDGPYVLTWILAMFMTRVGASFVEVTTEGYFFKHTQGTDANIISFFRITRPLASVIGALLGSLALLYIKFELLFVLLGLLMIPGLFFTMALKDTR